MISALSEDALSLTQAAALPNAPDRSSLWRWILRGVKTKSGETIYLQAVRLGSRLYTSRESIDKFSAALAEADRRFYMTRAAATPRPERQPSERQQERAAAEAETRLRARGIL